MRPKLKLRYYSVIGTYRIGRRSCRCSPANPYELMKEKVFWRSRRLGSKVRGKSRLVVLIDVLFFYKPLEVAIYSLLQLIS